MAVFPLNSKSHRSIGKLGPTPVRPGITSLREDKPRPHIDTPPSLPHERDESGQASAAVPDPVMAQAKRDIDAGLVDTDMRATPGLDAKRRATLVPGPGGKPPSSVA
eukprot:gene33885-43777_t